MKQRNEMRMMDLDQLFFILETLPNLSGSGEKERDLLIQRQTEIQRERERQREREMYIQIEKYRQIVGVTVIQTERYIDVRLTDRETPRQK